jgi:hypothetical protein
LAVLQTAPVAWPRRRWWLMLILIFCGQLALIFGLSSRLPLQVRTPARAPVLQFANSHASELMALWDPTLFALPHRRGFSTVVRNVRQPAETSVAPQAEPIEYLDFSGQGLGAVFDQFVATNRFEPTPLLAETPPDLGLPPLVSPQAVSAPSRVRVEGPLAQRKLLSRIVVPPMAHTEILAPTVVEIMVDADGLTVSSVIPDWARPAAGLPSGSGSKEADQRALQLARGARFESIRPSGPDLPATQPGALTPGRLIFEWQTVPTPQ